jgi:5-methylcytosine-specific restriction endonuclease McrA
MSFVDPGTAYASYKEFKPLLFKKHGGCQACGNERYDELIIHHVSYERYGQEKSNDLRLLCWRCHNRFHEKVKGTDPDLRYLTNLFIKNDGMWEAIA